MEGGASKKIKDVLVITDTHPLTYFKREDKVGEHFKTANTTSRKCQSILLILLAAATVAQACFYFSQINSISDKISSLEKRVTRLQTELDLQVIIILQIGTGSRMPYVCYYVQQAFMISSHHIRDALSKW